MAELQRSAVQENTGGGARGRAHLHECAQERRAWASPVTALRLRGHVKQPHTIWSTAIQQP